MGTPAKNLKESTFKKKKKRFSREFPCGAADKDLALSLQQLGSLLCRGFDPWPGNFFVVPQSLKKKKDFLVGKSSVFVDIHFGAKFFFFLSPHVHGVAAVAMHYCMGVCPN